MMYNKSRILNGMQNPYWNLQQKGKIHIRFGIWKKLMKNKKKPGQNMTLNKKQLKYMFKISCDRVIIC